MTQGSLKRDLLLGFRGLCPCCGKGRIFRAFLKVADRCERCGEEFFHHRADDLPAYLVIVIVGHIVVALLLLLEATQALGLWAEVALFVPVTFAFALALLQPVKGAVVALQWHLGMEGFGPAKLARRNAP